MRKHISVSSKVKSVRHIHTSSVSRLVIRPRSFGTGGSSFPWRRAPIITVTAKPSLPSTTPCANVVLRQGAVYRSENSEIPVPPGQVLRIPFTVFAAGGNGFGGTNGTGGGGGAFSSGTLSMGTTGTITFSWIINYPNGELPTITITQIAKNGPITFTEVVTVTSGSNGAPGVDGAGGTATKSDTPLIHDLILDDGKPGGTTRVPRDCSGSMPLTGGHAGNGGGSGGLPCGSDRDGGTPGGGGAGSVLSGVFGIGGRSQVTICAPPR